jgi:hypothetical protein
MPPLSRSRIELRRPVDTINSRDIPFLEARHARRFRTDISHGLAIIASAVLAPAR